MYAWPGAFLPVSSSGKEQAAALQRNRHYVINESPDGTGAWIQRSGQSRGRTIPLQPLSETPSHCHTGNMGKLNSAQRESFAY